MKTLTSLLVALVLVLMPLTSFAQLNVPQGGTGQTSFTAGRILYGGTSLRLGSEAAFTYDSNTNTLTADNGVFTSLTLGTVSNTEFGYLDGVTSAIQTQLNAKQDTLGNDDITPDMILSTGQTDEYCLTYEATGDTFAWQVCSSGSGDNISIDGVGVVDPNFASTGDIDFVDTSNTVTANINAGSIIEPDLDADVAATDGDFLQYDSTGTNFTWRDAGETRTDLGLVIGTNVQAYDADLTTYAGITPSANVQSLLSAADYAAMRTQLGLVIGTNVQAYDADLTTYAGITPSANVQSLLAAADYSAMRTLLSLGSLALLSSVTTSEITDDTITVDDINNSATIGTDPGWAANSTWFGTTGLIFEGTTANGFETLLTATDPTADRTLTLQNVTGTIYSSGGTDVVVADGGTGASTLTQGGILQGNGTGAITATAVLTNGQLLIGDGTTFPTVGTLTAGTGVSVTNGAGSITLASTLTAGRSLTLTGVDFAADAELYTDSKTIYFESPTASDDFKTLWVAPTGVTITSISCESDQTVNFDLQVDDGTPAGVNGSDIACTTFATDSSLAGDTTMATGDRLDLAITSVSGTPTWVSITFAYTKDD